MPNLKMLLVRGTSVCAFCHTYFEVIFRATFAWFRMFFAMLSSSCTSVIGDVITGCMYGVRVGICPLLPKYRLLTIAYPFNQKNRSSARARASTNAAK